jgi:PhzF family phenazine biosynthesis protein
MAVAEVVHTRVFAARPNGGNPCPVVPSADRLSDAQMQHIARTYGLDTVFALTPRATDADLRLRFFVPDHEMGVSGHATIAAITVAGMRSTSLRVETITGVFAVESVDGVVTLEQQTPAFGPTIPSRTVATILRVDAEEIVTQDSPVQSVSVSRAKLIIPVRSADTLSRLAPDYEALWRCCEQLGVTGFYPFTRHASVDADAEARQFPLRAGFPEDAATGVAAGALGAYLARYDRQYHSGAHLFRIAQGYAMGAPSVIEAMAECADGQIRRTAIRGTARIVGREHIAF